MLCDVMAMPPDGPARPLRSWRHVVAFSAGLVGGLIGALLQSLHGHDRRRRRSWSQRIFGYSKREVARLLGPPPAAAMGNLNAALAVPPTFWQADTWYYPVDRRRRKAVAVQFDADRVVKVEVLGDRPA